MIKMIIPPSSWEEELFNLSFCLAHNLECILQVASKKVGNDMEQVDKKNFGNKERYLAGKAQMKIFWANQYLYWRVAAVKSIKKIILDADRFYSDLEDEIYFDKSGTTESGDRVDIVNNEIKNGWLFEAVSQAEQAIEDLFSLLKYSHDIAYFAKNVINYNAPKVVKYIWTFDTDELEFIMHEFKLPYFSLKEPWEEREVFETYKESLLRMQQWLQELIAFHKKYYLDYCQYKHGMSVAMRPFGRQRTICEEKQDSHEGVLMTFDSYRIEKRYKASETLPQIALYLDPDISPYASRLHAEGNLLRYSLHVVNIDEVVSITEKAFTLLNIVWVNLLKRCERTNEDEINEWAFPTDNYKEYIIIGFPVE